MLVPKRMYSTLSCVRHMRVPIWDNRIGGSWGYLAGGWWEATPPFHSYDILMQYILQKMKQAYIHANSPFFISFNFISLGIIEL